jgi:hypothetical protein
MTLDCLAAELDAIEVWDADYRLQLLKHFESTQSYLARQARRVKIMELMQKAVTDAGLQATDANGVVEQSLGD